MCVCVTVGRHPYNTNPGPDESRAQSEKIKLMSCEFVPRVLIDG